MYCFLRVGPFISGEWDCGGYPAWLLAKTGIEFRTMNNVALPYIRHYFEQLIPQIVSRQATRGGPVILVQAENEWFASDRPGGIEYLEWLVRTLQELGVEVLITDCDDFRVSVPGSFKTIGQSEEAVRAFRDRYPQWPAMIYELYMDWMEMWGQPSVMPNSQLDEFRQRTMQSLSLRAMFNYYMFHGGTNFGFWASSTDISDQCFITTRYWFNAPVCEGGALDEMYFATKGINLLATNFNEFFSNSSEAPMPVGIVGPVRGRALRSPQGFMLFVLPQYPDHESSEWNAASGSPALYAMTETRSSRELALQPGCVRLPSGGLLELAEGSAYPLMVPFQFQIDEQHRLDYSNATMLGMGGTTGQRIIILQGEAGHRGMFSINGQAVEVVFSPDEPVKLTVSGLTVVAVSRELADQTWFADGRILIGPAYVGEPHNGQHECWFDNRSATIHTISSSGEYHRSLVPAEAVPNRLVRLTGWRAKPLPELKNESPGWRDIGAPKPLEQLGSYYGYAWYRAFLDSDEERDSNIFLTLAADRFHIFHRGKKSGVWGRGAQASRNPLPVHLVRGTNEFVFLCDNMGRYCEGKCMDRKGIQGSVYLDAIQVPLGTAEYSVPSGPPRESWEFRTFRSSGYGKPTFRFSRLRFRVPIKAGDGGLLVFRWVPQYGWVYVNGRLAGEHGGDCPLISGVCFSEFVLDSFLSGDHADIELVFYGEPIQDVGDRVVLFTFSKQQALVRWQFKPWQDPVDEGSTFPDSPVWWEGTFDKPDLPGPLFLATQGLSKGQAYLNGKALGRYWEIGPQHSLYLPEPWLADHNCLALFDEEGKSPDGVYIFRDGRYPTRKVLI
jgi:hypothetical protein